MGAVRFSLDRFRTSSQKTGGSLDHGDSRVVDCPLWGPVVQWLVQALSERKVAGSIPTIGDFHTVGPSCKKAVFACLATDVKIRYLYLFYLLPLLRGDASTQKTVLKVITRSLDIRRRARSQHHNLIIPKRPTQPSARDQLACRTPRAQLRVVRVRRRSMTTSTRQRLRSRRQLKLSAAVDGMSP